MANYRGQAPYNYLGEPAGAEEALERVVATIKGALSKIASDVEVKLDGHWLIVIVRNAAERMQGLICAKLRDATGCLDGTSVGPLNGAGASG